MKIGIRLWKMADSQDLAKAINNKIIQDNLRDGLPFPYSASDAEAFITEMLEADPNIVYARAITVDDVAVGGVGVFRKDNVHRLTAEMGYYVAEEYWGKGVMSEAIKLICSFIFSNTDIIRIFALPFSSNVASCRVLEKNGFVCEGILRKNAIKNDKIVDMKMYALIKD